MVSLGWSGSGPDLNPINFFRMNWNNGWAPSLPNFSLTSAGISKKSQRKQLYSSNSSFVMGSSTLRCPPSSTRTGTHSLIENMVKDEWSGKTTIFNLMCVRLFLFINELKCTVLESLLTFGATLLLTIMFKYHCLGMCTYNHNFQLYIQTSCQDLNADVILNQPVAKLTHFIVPLMFSFCHDKWPS